MRKSISIIPLIIIIMVNLQSYSQINATVLNPEITITIPDSIGTNYYNFDIDTNGTVDFRFSVKSFTTSEFSHMEVNSYSSSISGLDTNEVNVGPFQYNASISSSIYYFNKVNIYRWMPEFGGVLGSWPNTLSSSDDIAYIGLKLNKGGNSYYGWVKLKSDGRSITLYSYAMNTNSTLPILAGQEN